jgi:hypothetical protein
VLCADQKALAIAGMKRILALEPRLLILFGAHVRRCWDETDGLDAAIHGPVAFGAVLLWCVIPAGNRKPYLLMDQHHPCCVRATSLLVL